MGWKQNINKYIAVKGSRHYLKKKKDYLILDTETTGLKKKDVIIQIAIIDLDGNSLLNSLVKPTQKKKISSEAIDIHGITLNMLKSAPSFRELWPRIEKIIGNKTLLIYNANFDLRLLVQTANSDGFRIKDTKGNCMMKLYSMYIGDWSDYHGNYKFQRLPGGDHTAVGDCLACLNVIKLMANTELKLVPTKWWKY